MTTIPVEKLFEKWMKDPEFKKEYDNLEEEFGEKMSSKVVAVVSGVSYYGSDKPVQTRSEETGLNYFDTVQEALDAAKSDETIWKISFKLGNERLRLVRTNYTLISYVEVSEWVLEGTQGAMTEEVQSLYDNYHNHADEGRRLDVLILTKSNSLLIQSM